MAGVVLQLSHSGNLRGLHVTTAIDGAFEMGGLPRGSVSFRPEDVTLQLKEKGTLFALTPARPARAELTAIRSPAKDIYYGIVVNDRGEPVGGAPVAYWNIHSRQLDHSNVLHADAEGRFSIYAGPWEYSFEAWDPAGKLVPARVPNAAKGSGEVRLQLSARRTFFVRVEGDDGALAADCLITVRSGQRPEFKESWRRAFGFDTRVETPYDVTQTASGPAEVVAPGEGPCTIVAEGPTHLPRAVELQQCPGPGETVKIILQKRMEVRGRVTRDGSPVVGARVTLHDAPAGREICMIDGVECAAYPRSCSEDVTNGQGEFVLRADTATAWAIRVQSGDYRDIQFGPYAREDLSRGTRLECPLPSLGLIRGRVKVAAGETPGSVFVLGALRGSLPRSVKCNDMGEFVFGHCVPGTWTLDRTFMPVDPERYVAGAAAPASVKKNSGREIVVEPGRETVVDLDFSQCPRLEGSVSIARCDVIQALVMPDPGSAALLYPFQNWNLDEQDRFSIIAREPGSVRLELTLVTASFQKITIRKDLQLSSGLQRWDVAMETGKLKGTIRREILDGDVIVEQDSPLGTFSTTCRPGKDGTFEFEVVPAGSVKVMFGHAGSKSIDSKPAVVAPGSTAEVLMD
jgi:hypothetical protein